jgi:hypothetical protein
MLGLDISNSFEISPAESSPFFSSSRIDLLVSSFRALNVEVIVILIGKLVYNSPNIEVVFGKTKPVVYTKGSFRLVQQDFERAYESRRHIIISIFASVWSGQLLQREFSQKTTKRFRQEQ